MYSLSTLGKDWQRDLIYMSKDFSFYENDADRYINFQATSINHKDHY